MDAAASFLSRTFTRQQTLFGVGWGNISPNLLSPSGKYNPDDIQKSLYDLGSRLNDKRLSKTGTDGDSKSGTGATDGTGTPESSSRAKDADGLLPSDMVVVSVKSTLRRFLKARDLDVDAAFDMIVDTMDWRERERMAAILDEPLDAELLEFIDERYPGYYCGFDREGYPIYYEHTPGVKWLELLDKIGFDESIRLHYKLMEFQSRVLCLKATKRASTDDAPYFNTRDKFVNVLDMHNLSLSIFWDKRITEVLSHVSAVDQAHYPELLRRAYIINAPFTFKAAYAVVKPFLAKSTQDKIRVLGSKQDSLDAVKLALGDDANLPDLMYHGQQKTGPNAAAGKADPAKAVLLLQDFLKHRKQRIAERRDKEVRSMMENVADPLITPSASYAELTEGDGEDDGEEIEQMTKGEDEAYSQMSASILGAGEKSFRMLVNAESVAAQTSEYMTIHAPLHAIEEDADAEVDRDFRRLPSIRDLKGTVRVPRSSDDAYHTDDAPIGILEVNIAGVELNSSQSQTSVLLLCHFCRHASVLYGVYGCLLFLSTVAVAFRELQESPSTWPFRIADFTSTMSASAQMLLSYYIYMASLDFEARYNERRTLWHIEMVGMVDLLKHIRSILLAILISHSTELIDTVL